MIKSQDLRIGDIVMISHGCMFHKGTMCAVTEIRPDKELGYKKGVVSLSAINDNDGRSWGTWLCNVEGIPLTPKILENNGWKLYEPSTKMYIKSNSNLAVCFPPHSDKVQVYYVVEHLRTIKYVHEFQHILWALGFDADMKIPDERKDNEDKT